MANALSRTLVSRIRRAAAVMKAIALHDNARGIGRQIEQAEAAVVQRRGHDEVMRICATHDHRIVAIELPRVADTPRDHGRLRRLPDAWFFRRPGGAHRHPQCGQARIT
jgi:hypothetical protein